MNKKNRFRRSLLSSAILAASLQGIATSSQAIQLVDSTVSDSLVNTGDINSHGDGVGIIVNPGYEGGFINSGDIIAPSGSILVGGIDIILRLDIDYVGGDIGLMGSIFSAGNGVEIIRSDIDGDLINGEELVAGSTGIVVRGEEVEPEGDGEAVINPTTISGNIINSGSIVAGENGLLMKYVEVGGNLDTYHEGSGSIIAGPQGGDPDFVDGYEGIELDDVNIAGNVVLGDISASGYGIDFESTTIAGDLTSKGNVTATRNDALYLYRSQVGGSFVNEGQLTAGREGIQVDDTTIDGDFKNSGVIDSGGPGIYFHRGHLGSDFVNEGAITAEDDAGILFLGNNTIAGDFTNTGPVRSDNDRGIEINGDVYFDHRDNELVVSGMTTISGSFVNSGTIDSGSDGIFLSDVNIGSALTPGSVAVNNTGDVTSAYDTAIILDGHSTINGSVVNEGTLTGIDGLRLLGNANMNITEQESGDSLRELEIREALIINGNVENRGVITAESNGIEVRGMQLKGDLQNTGIIAVNQGNAIVISNSIVSGNIENNNELTVSEKYAGDGIELREMTLEGSLINRGVMNINGSEGIDLDNVLIKGSVINEAEATLTVRSDGFYFDNAHIKGDVINHGNIVAIENDGIEFEVDGPGDYRETPAYIEGSVLNTGDIIAGDIGIEMGGEHNSEWVSDGADGEIRVWTTQYSMIGQSLVNEGSIDAYDTGIHLKYAHIGQKEQRDNGQADFNNRGDINAGHGSGIDVEGSRFGGDFINSGDITANAGERYDRGDYYQVNSDEAGTPDGELVLTSLGVDEHGDAWFSIKNNSDQWQDVNLVEEGSLFELDEFGGIHQGREMIVNAGSLENGANIQLVQDGVGVITETAANTITDFQPVFNFEDGATTQRGISMTSRVFDDEGEDGRSPVPTTIAGSVVNSGSILSRHEGLYLNDIEVNEDVVNRGSITSELANSVDIRATRIGGNLINEGRLDVSNGRYQKGDYYLEQWSGTPSLDGDVILEAQGVDSNNQGWYRVRNESDNPQPLQLSDTNGDFELRNIWLEPGEELYVNVGEARGDITLSHHWNNEDLATVEASEASFEPAFGERTALKLADTDVEGLLMNTGTISSNENAVDIAGGSLAEGMFNAGIINAAGVAIHINGDGADGAATVAGILNTGAITSSGDAALRVEDAVVEVIVNTGTITGGTVAESEVSAASDRNIAPGSQVAIDYRASSSALALANGLVGVVDNETVIEQGDINGDIYGSRAENGDDIIELAAGSVTGDIYDVEQVYVTGTFTLDNTLFSLNDNSTLTVADTGTLVMGAIDKVTIEGSYDQLGRLNAVLDQNEGNFEEALITATGGATLDADSTIGISIKDRDLSNFNPGDGNSQRALLVSAGNGNVVDNGADLVSETILVSLQKVNDENGFQVEGSINSLGDLASNGGADTNAANLLSAIQGIDSAGYIDLQTSNPDLYNAIYDGSEASLAVLAEQMLASPESGIAAGQSAQAEAVNTILTRIAELRAGTSGISAGDEASSVRPDSLWIRAIYSDGEQDATTHNGNNFNSYALRSKGFTIGVDKDVSDTLTLGLGASVVNSTADDKGGNNQVRSSNSETDTYLGSLYAGWRNQDYFADASVNIGQGSTDLKGSGWEADYDSTQMGVSALAGKSFLFNNNDSLVEPRVGFNYTRLETDEYSYQSNGERIAVSSQTLEALEVGAGVRFITGIEVGDGLLLPEATVMAWHDFKADEVEVDIEFETAGGAFTYFGPEAVKTRYQAGVGAEYLMDNNFTVSMNYEHNWQDGFKADTWVAKVRYDF